MIEIQHDSNTVLQALTRLQRVTSDLSPALKEIGEQLSESTKQRFASTVGPDDKHWLLNTPATLDHKEGDRPLTGKTGVLASTINYQMTGPNALAIGSPMEYAAMQQFGGTKADFSHLWGDIPARPFLGISEQDEADILNILQHHLQAAL